MIQRLFHSRESSAGPWRPLRDRNDWAEVRARSAHRPQVLLKHSTRCGASAMAKHQLEQAWPEAPEAFDLHYLDVIADRSISNQVARDLDLTHHSPQLIVLWQGELIFHTSHHRITPEALRDALDPILPA